MKLGSRHQKTLEKIFARPTTGTLEWRRVENLLVALGCGMYEGKGSRVAFHHETSGEVAHFHRPHPRPEATKGMIESVRDYIERIGAVGTKEPS